MFELRSQPLKGIYLVYIGFSTFLRLPFWTLASIPRSSRPRESWTILKSVLLKTMKLFIRVMYRVGLPKGFIEDLDAANESTKLKSMGFVVVPAFPEDLLVGEIKELASRQGVKTERTFGFWYQRKDLGEPSNRKATPSEKVALLFHGGAMTMGSPQPGAFGSNELIAKGLLDNSPRITHIFSGGYRLSSSSPFAMRNPFPAALLDAISCYHYLLHDMGFRAQDIILGGDSAGGFLAIALARYLALSKLLSLPVPGALLLLSPVVEWVQLHGTGPGNSWERNNDADPTRPIYQEGYTLSSLAGNIPSNDALASPWFSPGSPDLPKDVADSLFVGFPKTFIHVGEAEIHLDAVRTLRERLVNAIGEDSLRYVEHVDATHDIISLPLLEPERTEACKEICAWIELL